MTRALLALLAAVASAQTNPASLAAHQWRTQHERQILDEFLAFLAIPNLSSDRPNIERNAQAIVEMLRKRAIPAKLLTVPGANPVVFGELTTPGATRSILFYAHYDGQPLDPREWASPPFTPLIRDKSLDRDGRPVSLASAAAPYDPEWRIYARGAADDKAPILAMLTAIDAIRAAGLRTRSNIKFVFEGEEEAGSKNLDAILEANRALLAADVWLSCDGPLHQTRRQSIVFGERGLAGVDLTVYGPRNELHSGHYGNWAPNPAMMLVQLLASMKDPSGRILIDHFYDGIEPLSAIERQAIAEAPDIDQSLMQELWLGSTENAPRKLAELINLPSLNIRGMASSRTGALASNVIPSTATATIDMRLVKGMDPKTTVDRLIEHVRKQGYFVVDQTPSAEIRRAHPKVALITRSAAEPPHRVSMDLPISKEIIRVVESARGPSIKMPTSGGTGPDAGGVLGMPQIDIPIANHDNNQHSFNENLRLQNLWDAIDLMAALLTM